MGELEMISQAFPIKCAMIFAALFALDFVYAAYTRAVTAKRPTLAAHYGLVIILIGGFSVIEYTSNHWLIIPAALGAWCGTFTAVKYLD